MALPEMMFLHALRVSTANPTLRIHDGTGNVTVTLNLAILSNYFMSGDNEADDLVARLEDALNSSALVFTVTIDSRNFITISSSGTFSILWGDAATTLDPTWFGFTASTSGPATSVTATRQTKGVWIPGTASRSVPKLDDTRKEPVSVGALMETIDGDSRSYDLSSTRDERTISFRAIDRSKILTEYAAATEPYGALDYAWENGLRRLEVRCYDDRTSRTSTSYMRARFRSRGRPWAKMATQYLQRYEVTFDMREVA